MARGKADDDAGAVAAQLKAAQAELAQARLDLAETRMMLSLTEQTAQLGYWRVDATTLKVHWSPQVFAIHGLPFQQEPDLVAAVNCYHRCDRDKVRQAVLDALSQGKAYSVQARLVRGDGAIAHVRSDGKPTYHDDGSIAGVFGIFQDITASVEVAQDLQTARLEAEAANAAKSNFLAMMSHEVRTPVSGIMSAIELLRRQSGLAEHESLFSSLDRSAKTLMRLLNDVLDYSGLELGKLAIRPSPFDLGLLIEETLALFEPLARSKGIRLAYASDWAPALVEGDQQRIQQILGNLVGNAIRFTEQGEVVVRCVPVPGQTDVYEIQVRDTGIGIGPDTAAHLFAPFVQSDDATRRRYGGTGLGLAISQKLARAMGGLITAQSNPDVGSLFSFTLPLPAVNMPPQMRSADGEGEREDAGPASLRIVIAEDQETNLLLMSELIGMAGHRVVAALDGHQAVDAVANGDVDLVIMDMHMPMMTGLEAVAAIRALPGVCGQVPIIALTADVLTDWAGRLRPFNVFATLHKPIDYAELKRLIRKARSEHPRAGPPVIRRERIDQLFDQLGREGAMRLLAMLRTDLAIAPAKIVALARQGDLEAAARQSHALIGALRNFGADALVAALEPLAQGQQGAGGYDAIVAISARTADAVAELCEVARSGG